MLSMASWLAWLSASMLRRCAAHAASTSKGWKRKSANILVTSKSNGLGRASAMGMVPISRERFCAMHNAYIMGDAADVKKILQCSKVESDELNPACGCSGVRPPSRAEPALDPAQSPVERRH